MQQVQFDEIRLDVDGHRLFRAGVEQPLEPKAFAVLLLLIGRPGHVLARDDILDAVWGHAHITPGTLNRIVTLLRHALGEDAQNPRYLHTVHGVGYRFDGNPVASPAEVAVAPVPAAAVEQVPAEIVAAGPIATGVPHPQPAARPFGAGSVLMLVLALVAAGAGWLSWRQRAQPPASIPQSGPTASAASLLPATSPRPVLAVLPLRPLGETGRSAEFADGLSEELIGLLAGLEGLRVTSRTSSFQFRDSSATAAQIGAKLNATHLLEGSVRADGERLRINLRLVDAGRDTTLWTEVYDREFRDIFAIQSSIAEGVAQTLRLNFNLPPELRQPGEDPELYRRYLKARQYYSMSPRRGDYLDPARLLLRELVTEHPDYARAWGGLAAITFQRAAYPSPQRAALRAESEDASRRALQLDPAQPDALAVLAGVACREGRWHDCISTSAKAVKGAPSDTMWRSWHAQRLATVGYVQEALRETERAIEIDPLSPSLHLWHGRVLDTLGRHDEAWRSFEDGDSIVVGQTAMFYNAMWRRDYDTADALARSLELDVPWRATQRLAVQAMRDPARDADLREAIARSEVVLAAEGLQGFDFNRSFLRERDYATDLEGLDRVRREGYASYHWNMWMPEERELRQSRVFHDYLRDVGLIAYWREHGWPDVCRSDGKDGAVCD